MIKIKPVKLSLYPMEASESHRFFMFSGGIKWNIDLKWVKEQQYCRERHNFMLLAWNASSSVVKQNDCKNKTTLSKYSFFYFMPLTVKTSKNFSKDYFFAQN